MSQKESTDVLALSSLAETYLHGSRLRYLGGTTNNWLGFCRPLDEIDLVSRPWVPHSGWPFASEALEPYYRRAALCQAFARRLRKEMVSQQTISTDGWFLSLSESRFCALLAICFFEAQHAHIPQESTVGENHLPVSASGGKEVVATTSDRC